MTHVAEQLSWSFMSVFGAILGYLLHLMMSWKEWAKVSKQPGMSFGAFMINDPASQITGIILVIFVYCSLSAFAQWDVAKDMLGFYPKVDFFGAFMTAFASQGFGVKLANIMKKLNSVDGA